MTEAEALRRYNLCIALLALAALMIEVALFRIRDRIEEVADRLETKAEAEASPREEE